MTAGAAVVADSLSKRYRLGATVGDYSTLREKISELAARPVRRRRRVGQSKQPFVWALRDVSFTVEVGEVVGVIGRNGAGKTTVLKILSRITTPTSGWAEVRGRVGSLLEVGTGFHPELTGRENVYLSGAILGMRKADIDRRYPEIVGFAGVDDFLDTPIKRYSSGMKVRLAFAVAAHLEPEILIVDEVLAVGDLAFQRKCLGKMGELTGEGRTVLFVSHNMSVLSALCRRGIYLERGRVAADGPIGDVVAAYVRRLEESSRESSLIERTDRRGLQQVKVATFEASALDGGPLVTGEAVRFVFGLTSVQPGLSCMFTIYDHVGHAVTTFNSASVAPQDDYSKDSAPRFECVVDELLLLPGRYRVDVMIASKGIRQDSIQAAGFIEIGEGLVRGRPLLAEAFGNVTFPHRWAVPAGEG